MTEYFNIAIKEAKKAYKANEIPVGAVMVSNNKIIAKAHNNRQKKYSVLGHAEIIAITKAEKKSKDWRLDNCVLYVTLEPCDMCATIIKESRIKDVYYLIKNNSNSANNSFVQTNVHNQQYEEYQKMLKNFFDKLRNKT